MREVGAGWSPLEWPVSPAAGSAPLPERNEWARARSVLDTGLASVHTEDGGVSIEPKVIGVPAGMTLVDASRGVDLLIVGPRADSDRWSRPLGSVGGHSLAPTHSSSSRPPAQRGIA